MLYVKSVAADGYTVRGDEGKIELTCAEAAATKEYTDVLTASMFAATSTGYTDFTGVSYSGGSTAVYAGNSAKDTGAIQLRSKNSNSGIVTTTSGGKVKKITIQFASKTAKNRVVDIYGNSNVYAEASDLYDTSTNTNQGKKIGSLTYNGTNATVELNVTEDYEYIGLRSNSGAIYITSITIVWEK